MLMFFLLVFSVYKDEFSHFFVCSGVLAISDPYRWVSQNNHFHVAEGSSQGVQNIDGSAFFTAEDKQKKKKNDQSGIDY